ncbi:single-stranded DNA-binding protein [Pseudonocardia nantongensis]|uniref:single-stranded DNA-binding protein n=1 Tax=Pseudonocardia nantongensis TaxID=1181885 RepID=UPI00397A0170
MNEITLVGNIGKDDPKLVYSERTGEAVLKFSFAQNDRYRDRQTGEWRDTKPVWTDVVAFGDLADNAAESLHARAAVIVIGKFVDNSFRPVGEDGQLQSEVRRTEFRALAIGPDLRRATATVTRQPRRERTGSTTAPQPAT